MYCTKCGKENKDDVRFCSYCGAEISVLMNETKNVQKKKEIKKDKPLEMKRAKKAEYIESYNLILSLIVVAYMLVGGGIGYFIGGMFGSYDSSVEMYVFIGLIIGGVVGFSKVIVSKILVSIAENIYSLTNNVVLLGENKTEEK